MKKAEEIALLQATAAKLRSGYTGAWLADQIGHLEDEIRADILPGFWSKPYSEWRQDRLSEAAQIKADAESAAAKIIENATREADRIKADANRYRDSIRNRIQTSIRQSLCELSAV